MKYLILVLSLLILTQSKTFLVDGVLDDMPEDIVKRTYPNTQTSYFYDTAEILCTDGTDSFSQIIYGLIDFTTAKNFLTNHFDIDLSFKDDLEGDEDNDYVLNPQIMVNKIIKAHNKSLIKSVTFRNFDDTRHNLIQLLKSLLTLPNIEEIKLIKTVFDDKVIDEAHKYAKERGFNGLQITINWNTIDSKRRNKKH